MSKFEETQHTTFLAERLTKITGNKFSAQLESEQNSDTDTWVVDGSGVRVPVQNVTSEGEVLRNMDVNTKAFKKGMGFIAGEVRHADWITQAISGKEKKAYSHAQELVLVVHASMPILPANLIKNMMIIPENSFAGIYYVSVHNSSSDSGYVIALKKYWDTPDVF